MGDQAFWKKLDGGGFPTGGAELVWRVAGPKDASNPYRPAGTAASSAAEAERRRLEEETRATAMGYRGRSSFLAGSGGGSTLGGI